MIVLDGRIVFVFDGGGSTPCEYQLVSCGETPLRSGLQMSAKLATSDSSEASQGRLGVIPPESPSKYPPRQLVNASLERADEFVTTSCNWQW
jgi:hypothetical protein